MKYFLKEMCLTPYMGPDGKTHVPFEIFPSNTGVIALDEEKDKAMIAHLDEAASKRKGGIVPIDEAAYEQLKKNRGGSQTSAAFLKQPHLKAIRSPSDPLARTAAASPAANGEGQAANPSVPGGDVEAAKSIVSGESGKPRRARQSDLEKAKRVAAGKT